MSFLYRSLFAVAISLFITWNSYAQKSTILGKVTDLNDEPVIGASVFLDGTVKGSSTNPDGEFLITNVSGGSYILVISSVGYKTIRQKIEVPLTKALSFILQEESFLFDAAVITATRTQRDQESIPTPVTVIPEKEIEMNGNTRLDDILSEQTGLAVIDNFGKGVQLQGLDPDYTLILVDGEPLIGRSAGTLDLSRINVGNIKQIEVVKGPSSAIWGSDALAGVINIITEDAKRPLSLSVDGRIGNFNAYQSNVELGINESKYSTSNFFSLEGTDGFNPTTAGGNGSVPSLYSYSLSSKHAYQLNNDIKLTTNARYYYEDVESAFDFETMVNDTSRIQSNNRIQDFSINPGIEINFDIPLSIMADYYLSNFSTETIYSNIGNADPDEFEDTSFDQQFQKYEMKNIYSWDGRNMSTLGFGQNIESLEADTYAEDSGFTNSFVYLQHEWYASDLINISGGFRFDNHSEFDSRLTPKFSLLFKPTSKIHARASVGTGFRAPDFRQLFLDFDNPVAGYSVYGARNAVNGLNRLQDLGLLSQIIVPQSQLQTIEAETSLAFNAGIDIYPSNDITFRINAFRNDVNNLIEFQPIAVRTSSQFVFSYFNLDEVRSQGVEAELRYKLPQFLGDDIQMNLSTGFQYLDATREVQDTRNVIENGILVTRTQTKRLQLQNRSRESGNIKLFVDHSGLDTQFSIRAAYRGSFNIGDINGNNRFDDFETADGFWIWDTSVSKSFNKNYTLQVGADNIFGYTDRTYLPGQLGARYYARFSINIY